MTEQDKIDQEEKRKKTIEEALSKGKLQRAPTKEERKIDENMFKGTAKGGDKKKPKAKKEGGGMWYYEDTD